MPVDGCRESFSTLANRVLPDLMDRLRQMIDDPIPMSEFGISGVGPVGLQRLLRLDHDPAGCYVLLDHGKPIYVGRSQHILQRLIEHVRGGDHYSATLAYQMASREFCHETTAIQAMENDEFRPLFDKACERLTNCDVAFVEIDDQVTQCLFEVYAAMELDTGLDNGGWNTFASH